MEQSYAGFELNQEMGLFTFYKMQEPFSNNNGKKQTKHKLAPINKVTNRQENKEPLAKRRVQSVIDCQKGCDQIIAKRALSRKIELHNKKLSEAIGQQKHSIVDFSFDFSPLKRKNVGKQLFQTTVSQRMKTSSPGSTNEEHQLFSIQESHYFHSVNLMKMNEIKREEIKELLKTQKEKDICKILQIKHKTQVEKCSVLSSEETDPQSSFKSMNQNDFLKKSKKEKPQPLNFLQYLQLKKKKMSEEYKKVRLNKKISDILKIKVNQQCPIKLKRVGFDRAQLSYLVPNVKYPTYQ